SKGFGGSSLEQAVRIAAAAPPPMSSSVLRVRCGDWVIALLLGDAHRCSVPVDGRPDRRAACPSPDGVGRATAGRLPMTIAPQAVAAIPLRCHRGCPASK